MAARSTKAAIITVLVAAVVIGGALGLRSLWNTAKAAFASDTCTVGAYDLDPSQAAVASTMVGAVRKYRVALPERAAVLVLAAALQESKLTNLPAGGGDRDSVGVLQQRPSQGWGKMPGKSNTIAARTRRLTDVGEATREFLDALVKVPHWRTLSLAAAVQAVQISADPSGASYGQHKVEAQALADALQGKKPAAITCSFDKPTKVASTETVAFQASTQLGINTPTVAGSSVRVPGARWQTVAWFVANADRLGIEQVAYDKRLWTRSAGWQRGTAPATAVIATMYQLPKK